MRLIHFVLQGRAVGGLEQLLADVLGAETSGVEHAVVMHEGEQCEFAGRWPVRTAAFSAEGEADPDAVVRTIRELNGACLFHSPPHRSVTTALRSAGLPLSVFCHGHEWWCASGSRYHAHLSRPCAIHASTAACTLRYHALGCGSLRLGNMVRGLARARAGRAALAAADTVCVLSTFMGREAERHGAGSGSVRVIPAPTALAGTGVRPLPREPRVVFASRLTREKGVDTLLRAFAWVGLGIALDIAGTGIAASQTAERLQRHPARSRIHLLGQLDRPALLDALARASVVVVPSVWPEPFGIVGIEALALGRPVVASTTGGMSEWAREELGVLTVPPGDAGALASAIARAVDEPTWRERAASAGAAWVAARHTPSATAVALGSALGPQAPI
ncbi:MAG: glycosyltransferase family 4 protein [Gemmatimonadales bacterium]